MTGTIARPGPAGQDSSGRQGPSGRKHDGGTHPPGDPLRTFLGPRQTGPARWVLAAAIFVAVMASSLGLQGVLRDMRWLPLAAVVVAGTLLLPALMRRYQGLAPFAPLGALAGWFMSMTLVFFPGTAVLGFIPTTGTLSAVLDLATDASSTIMHNLAPAPSVPDMHFVLSAGLGFAALLIDTLVITVAIPPAGILGLVLVLLPAALTTRTGISTPGLVGTAGGYLLMLGAARWYAPDGKLRTDTPKAATGVLVRATALGAAVVLLMTMVTGAIPGFTKGLYPQGASLNATGVGGSLDPMLSLGDDLRSQSSRVTLHYTTSAPEAPAYLRLTTLENFQGKTWEPSALPSDLQAKLSGLSPAAGPNQGLEKVRTTTRITVPGVGDVWLPAPLTATDVQQLPGVWLWNPETATIMSQTSTTAGQSYTVRSEMPALTPAVLNGATAAPRGDLDPIFSKLPNDVPQIVSTTALELTAAAPSPYAKAMAIQDYFRSDDFSYSLSTPVAEGYDGSGMGVLETFLEQKSGYCVHFSAAMAVMAREVGIPSRIAVGYTAGSRATAFDTLEDGVQMRGFEVTGRDAHAWPELYFEGLGWVPFEPTPSRGNVPDYAQEDFAAAPVVDENQLLPGQATDSAPTSAPPTTAPAVAGAQTETFQPGRWLAGAGWVLLVFAVLLAPAVVRTAVRRRRLALVRDGWVPEDGADEAGGSGTRPTGAPTAGAGTGGTRTAGDGVAGTRPVPEVLAWREVVATAVDHGFVLDPTLTPALQAKAMAAFLGNVAPAGLELLLHSYEQEVYGGGAGGDGHPGREDLAEAAELMVSRFHTSATPWRRWRATFVPASFLPRRPTKSQTLSRL